VKSSELKILRAILLFRDDFPSLFGSQSTSFPFGKGIVDRSAFRGQGSVSLTQRGEFSPCILLLVTPRSHIDPLRNHCSTPRRIVARVDSTWLVLFNLLVRNRWRLEVWRRRGDFPREDVETTETRNEPWLLSV